MNRPPRLLPALLVLASLAACGDDAPTTRAAAPPDASPATTFAAFRQASLDGDWEAVYALNLPSERAEAERRWDAARAGDGHAEAFEALAAEAGLEVDAVRGMSLLEYFVQRNAHQAATSEGRMVAALREATFVESRPVPEGGVMAKVRLGEREQDFPMRQEDGRWYFHRILTALTDF